MGPEESGMVQCELLQLKEKISLLQSYLGQFYLPKEFEAAVADAFRDVLKRVDRIAIFLSGARKNDASL
jgi:hypothetical protein